MKVCENCGIHNSDSRAKCEECGGKLRQLNEWEIPKEEEKYPVKNTVKFIMIIVGWLAFFALVWVVFEILSNTVFLKGAKKDRQAVSGYVNAYFEDDAETCREYMLPFKQDTWIHLNQGIYGEFHSIGEVTSYSEEEMKELKSKFKDGYAKFMETASHVELKYSTRDTIITDRGIESEYITVVKYRGKWFVCPYDVDR